MADEPGPRGGSPGGGFTLVEALVALVVAGLVLAVFGRAMAGAWGSVKAPMDVVSGIVLARSAAFGAPPDAFAAASARGYTVDRSSRPIEVLRGPTRLAPPLVDSAEPAKPEPKATPSTMQLAEPKGIVQTDAKAPVPELRLVSVVVSTPAGRRLRFDTVRIDDAAP